MPLQIKHDRRGSQPLSASTLQLSVADIIEMAGPNDLGSQDEAIRALILLMRAKDPRAHEHGERTALYAAALGHASGFSRDELAHLHTAALLHDIGRLTLPTAIRQKSGPLSAREYERVQCHPRAGAEILAALPRLQIPSLWVAHHHERWDGSGYPYGLRGQFIPLGSRVLTVADMFDSIVSQKPSFGSAQDYASASRQLEVVSGSQLDPELVKMFLMLATDSMGFIRVCFTALAKH